MSYLGIDILCLESYFIPVFHLDIDILCPETNIFVFYSDIDVLSVYRFMPPIVPYGY